MGSCLSAISSTSQTIEVKTIVDEDSSLHVLPLPPEILQYISATFLPSHAVACPALCRRPMLKVLEGQALRSLRLERHAIEKTRFLNGLERDLPDRMLCPHCSKLHLDKLNRDLSQSWL